MSSQERFARAFLALKSAFNTKAGWDFWQRLGDASSLATLAKGEAKSTEKLLQTTFQVCGVVCARAGSLWT